MKKSFALPWIWIAVFAAFLNFSTPAFAVSHALMLQAQDLIHKAWNPGGKPPTDAKRIQLLHQALTLMANDPYTGYNGHKTKAIRYVHTAIFEIQNGGSAQTVNDYLQDAVDQCRSAIVDNED